MTSNYNTIEVEGEEIEYKKGHILYTLHYNTLYHTYQLLYCH